jgi:hypothetical protein
VGLTGFVAAAHAHTPIYIPPPAVAAGNLASLQVRDRDTGELLPLYRHDGRLYVAGVPGHRYAVSLANRLNARGLFVVSVDGVNALTGETANFSQAGYVLQSGQQFDVNGWRKSTHEVAAFTFTALPNSYAARTGRPNDVGTIGVALFREMPVVAVAPQPYPYPPAYPQAHPQGRFEKQLGAGPAAEAAQDAARGMARAPEHAPAPSASGEYRSDKLGTGHGERERSFVERTQFERQSTRPDEVITIYYDSRENLIAQGVIPRDFAQYRHRRPHAFPGERFADTRGFAPDPWR